MPEDFRYILGLHEGVVAGMADGYAQATRRPALVNLHAASGWGNAMGALTNAWYAHMPLVITAGQQVAVLEPAGPVYVSLPYDDWAQDTRAEEEHLGERTVEMAGESDGQLADLVAVPDAAASPVLVLRPDVDSARRNDDAVRLAESLGAPAPFPDDSYRLPRGTACQRCRDHGAAFRA